MNDLMQAAELRASGVRAPADRPSERRSGEFGRLNFTRGISTQVAMRASDTHADRLQFVGHASVYERGYDMWDMFGPYTEIVSAGAGAKSLARGDLSVPLVLDHDSLRRIAITDNGSLMLSEDEIGLSVLAPDLNPDDFDVRYIMPKIQDGLITEMSFRFRITAGVWSPDYTEYRINEYEIHRGDAAIVGYGANPFTDPAKREDLTPAVSRGKRGADLIFDHDTALRTIPRSA